MHSYSCRGEILCLDRILAFEHVIDLGQVVCPGRDGVWASRRREVLPQVSVFAQETHLFVSWQSARATNGENQRRHTSSYTSGATVRLALSLFCRSNFWTMSLTSPTILTLNIELARPLP